MSEPLPLVRTSERASFKRCPQQWYWAWRKGLRPRGRLPDALWFGTGVHVALAEYYPPGKKRGPHPAETWETWADGEMRSIKIYAASSPNLYGDSDEIIHEYTDAIELGRSMLERYVIHHKGDPSWDVIAREQPFGLMIPRRGTRREPFLRFHGTFDGVYRDLNTGYLNLMEHKTAAMISTRHLSLDDQAGGYLMAAMAALRRQGLIGENEYIRYIMYNFLRKALPDDRPQNADGEFLNRPLKAQYVQEIMASDIAVQLGLTHKQLNGYRVDQLAAAAKKYEIEVLGEVSKNQPPPYFERKAIERTKTERHRQLLRLQAEGESMDRFRTGEQPLYKTPRYDCHKFCAFFDLCEVDEAGGNTEEFAEAMYDVVDSYADHRKSTAE